MPEKVSKASVHYRAEPGPKGEVCKGCTMYREPAACTLVMGIIARKGYCVEHDPK